MFLERVRDTGMRGNRYWYQKTWNKGAGTTNALPNCTTFCVGEAYEATQTEAPFQMFHSPYMNPGAFPNAKDWYSNWALKKGIEPRIGGIAVWGASKTNSAGHVAFVLDCKDVGTKGAWMRVCQSNYKGTYFEVKEYTVKKGVITQGVGCPYVGCCYLDVNDKRAARNADLLQVKVLSDNLNVREKPNGAIYHGRVCPQGIYTILDTYKEALYTWAKLDEGHWIALNDKDGWTLTYQPTVEQTLEQKYETLKIAYDKLSQKYTDLALKYEKETGKKP